MRKVAIIVALLGALVVSFVALLSFRAPKLLLDNAGNVRDPLWLTPQSVFVLPYGMGIKAEWGNGSYVFFIQKSGSPYELSYELVAAAGGAVEQRQDTLSFEPGSSGKVIWSDEKRSLTALGGNIFYVTGDARYTFLGSR